MFGVILYFDLILPITTLSAKGKLIALVLVFNDVSISTSLYFSFFVVEDRVLHTSEQMVFGEKDKDKELISRPILDELWSMASAQAVASVRTICVRTTHILFM